MVNPFTYELIQMLNDFIQNFIWEKLLSFHVTQKDPTLSLESPVGKVGWMSPELYFYFEHKIVAWILV